MGLHFLQKSWFFLSVQFLQRGQKRLWFFCLLILLSKLLSATQHSAKTKFIPRSRAAAQNLAPLPFLCFQSLSSKYDCPADVVLGWMSWTYRLFKVQKIQVSCHFVCHFWMWWKMFAAAGETNLSLRHNWITSRFLARSFCCCRCCCRCCYGCCFREEFGSLIPAVLAR